MAARDKRITGRDGLSAGLARRAFKPGWEIDRHGRLEPGHGGAGTVCQGDRHRHGRRRGGADAAAGALAALAMRTGLVSFFAGAAVGLRLRGLIGHLMRRHARLARAFLTRHGGSHHSLQREGCNQEPQQITDKKAHKVENITAGVSGTPSLRFLTAYTFPRQEGQGEYGTACRIVQQPCLGRRRLI